MYKRIARKLFYLSVLAAGQYAGPARGENVALVFAPGEYQNLEAADFQTNAAARLKEHLQSDRELNYQIKVLTGASATRQNLEQQISELASVAKEDDAFLVVIHSFGTLSGHDNLVCTFDSIMEKDGTPVPESLVSTDAILQRMLESPSKRRLLIVDPIRPANNQWRFGVQGLKTTDNQWIFVNRSSPMSNGMTRFMQSVLDGFTWHGDANRNGAVSLLEFSEYLQLFAETQGFAVPFVFGKANSDFTIAGFADAQDKGLDIAVRNRIAQKLLESAERTLFHQLDATAAIAHLDRALRLRPSEPIRQNLNRLRYTSVALIHSDSKEFAQIVEKTLQEAQHNKTELRVLVAGKKIGLYPPKGTQPNLFIEPGTQLVVHKIVRGHAAVKQLVKAKVENGVVVQQSESIPFSWLRLSTYRPDGTDTNRVSEILGNTVASAPKISAL